jgi:luciferase family oxidoreductase group 1
MGKLLADIPVSILDLATVVQGDPDTSNAFKRSLVQARQAERFGFLRYWFAEHHNMESVASSATSVLIGYIAGGTSRIRVGSGGIMLPNHAPLVIAEQFGTLASLYPNRIDLGIGRAPGTDPVTSYALRRNMRSNTDEFPNDVAELIQYLEPADPAAKVKAVPGQGTQVPVWLLGSSTYSAQLAGLMGLPFAFASHFAPTYLGEALRIYRQSFRPSARLKEPYAMACVNVVIAETDEEAAFLATSYQQLALGIFRNERQPLQPPVTSLDQIWNEREKAGVEHMLEFTFKGSKTTVAASLQHFLNQTGLNELMVATNLYDLNKKLYSLEQTASLFKKS